MMESEALKQVEALALKKLKVFNDSIVRYLMRGVLACMFIGFGVMVAFKSGNYFYAEHSPFSYPMAAATFGAAIVLISYGGGDLFTGNTFYFTYAALRKKMKWSEVIKLWVSTYMGNIIGAVLFAILILITGLFKDVTSTSFLVSVVEKKMAVPTSELFFRAILCNWLVCLAFFIPMTLKGDGAKLFTMMLLVFCFFISGYEHSIANMCTFAIALITNHSENITFAGMIHNLVPVTLGNIIGGTVFMAGFYYYINKPFLDKE